MQSNGLNVVSCLSVVVLNTYCSTKRNKASLVILIVKSHELLSGFVVLSDQRRHFCVVTMTQDSRMEGKDVSLSTSQLPSYS
jgi:hypothetical protein